MCSDCVFKYIYSIFSLLSLFHIHILGFYMHILHIKFANFILFHLKMMTWSHRNVVHNSFRLFLSLNV